MQLQQPPSASHNHGHGEGMKKGVYRRGGRHPSVVHIAGQEKVNFGSSWLWNLRDAGGENIQLTSLDVRCWGS